MANYANFNVIIFLKLLYKLIKLLFTQEVWLTFFWAGRKREINNHN